MSDPNGFSYTVTYGANDTNLLESTHTVVVTFKNTLTNARSIDNTFEAKVMDGDVDVSSRYRIYHSNGKLTVTPRVITIKAGSASKQYDGTPLTCEEWEISSEATLCVGHTAIVTTVGSQTAVGRSDNAIESVKIIDTDGTDVTANYNIKFQYGRLTVSPK